MSESWNPSYLFLATENGFYFEDVKNLIANKGHIPPLEHPQIPIEIQEEFLQILNDFEG
jgi:hypothetical protein